MEQVAQRERDGDGVGQALTVGFGQRSRFQGRPVLARDPVHVREFRLASAATTTPMPLTPTRVHVQALKRVPHMPDIMPQSTSLFASAAPPPVPVSAELDALFDATLAHLRDVHHAAFLHCALGVGEYLVDAYYSGDLLAYSAWAERPPGPPAARCRPHAPDRRPVHHRCPCRCRTSRPCRPTRRRSRRRPRRGTNCRARRQPAAATATAAVAARAAGVGAAVANGAQRPGPARAALFGGQSGFAGEAPVRIGAATAARDDQDGAVARDERATAAARAVGPLHADKHLPPAQVWPSLHATPSATIAWLQPLVASQRGVCPCE